MQAAIHKLDNTQNHPFPHETKFPNTPSELPLALFNYAYPNEPPVSVDVPELKVAAASFKMRGQGSGSSSSGSMADSIAEAIRNVVGTSNGAGGWASFRFTVVQRVWGIARRHSVPSRQPSPRSRGAHHRRPIR